MTSKYMVHECAYAQERVNNTMRYINDLLVLNNPSFEDAIKDIYPTELQLRKNH